MSFEPNSLETRTTQSRTGGGYTSARFIPKEWVEAVPRPSIDDSAVIDDDFVLKAGKTWIPIFTDDKEFELAEEAGEARNSDSYNVTLTGFHPGENIHMRRLINDSIASMEGYMLLDSCKDVETLSLGKGKCCPGTLKINFKSGKLTNDAKGWTFTFKVEQEGASCFYRGVGAMTNTYNVAVDDVSPDVSKGTATYVLPENTAANVLTGLDNAVQGSLITLKWNSTTNHSTLTSGAVFQLASAFTPVTGAILILQATTTGTFAERSRHIPV